MNRLLCCCIVVSVFCAPAVASDNLENVKQAYQLGDFKRIFPKLRNLSNQGNPEADFLLGKMFERGHGVEQDESRAIQYYRNAAGDGFAKAKERLELLTGTENSVVLDWYLEAAWDGDASSQFNLGFIYETGMGVRIDEIRAVQWYEEASNQHYADAQLRLGMMRMTGAGGEQDTGLGEALIKTAASSENAFAKSLNKLLFVENNGLDAIQIIRGLRTIEDNSPETLIAALAKSVETLKMQAQNKQKADSLANNTYLNPPVKEEQIDVSTIDEQGNVQGIALLKPAEEPSNNTRTAVVAPIVTQGEAGNVVLYWVLFSVLVLGLGAYMVRKVSRRKTSDDGLLPALKLSDQIKVPELNVDTEDLKFLRELWADDKEKESDLKVSFSGENVIAKAATQAESENGKPRQDNQNNSALTVPELSVKEVATVAKTDNLAAEKMMAATKQPMEVEKTEEASSSDKVAIPQISSHALSQFRVDKAAIMQTVRNTFDPFMEKLMFQSLLPQQLEDLTFTAQALPSDDKVLISSKTKVELPEPIEKSASAKDAAFDAESAKIQTKSTFSNTLYALEQVKEIQASEGHDSLALAETRYNIGVMFAKGEGTPRNIKLAIKWLQKAAGLGHLEAREELSRMLAKYPEYSSMEQLIPSDEFDANVRIAIQKVS